MKSLLSIATVVASALLAGIALAQRLRSEKSGRLAAQARTVSVLKRFRENPRVLYVRIAVAGDCCPACREVQGAYPKDTVPHLPVEGCCHQNGCRCFYQPFLDEIYP